MLPRPSRLSIMSLSLLLLSILYHLVFSQTPILYIYWIIKGCEMTFFVFYAYNYLLHTKRLDIFFVALSIGVAFESVLAIAQFVIGSSVGFLSFVGERSFTISTPAIATASLSGVKVLRAYGTLPHPNVLAGYLFFTLLVIWQKRQLLNKYKMILYILFPLCVVALCLTLNRFTIFLALVTMLILFFKQKKGNYSLTQIFYGGLVLVVLLLLSLHYIIPRFADLMTDSQPVEKRIQLLMVAWTMIQEHPLFGVGPYQFIIDLPRNLITNNAIFFIQPVHNIFAILLLDIGLVGVTGIGLLFYEFYRRTVKRASLFQIVVIVLICLIGFVDHYFLTLQQGQLLLALMVAIIFVDLTVSRARR